MTRVLGIEGTAWAASAAVFDSDRDQVQIRTDPYEPVAGGIHPRDAAEHMQTALPRVIRAVLSDGSEGIDAVAFSRGPGLGPCLRVCGTAARAVAQVFEVSLVGVNHMVAHAEIGRIQSGFRSPVCLNTSGANAHVLGFQGDRYRVLGETMDTGIGNAIDKFARHVGWSHPGGPKVEAAAKDGSYVSLPYVVKGMDFSFAGITSAAQDAVDQGVPVVDVCRGLEETMFAMITEVAERALAVTNRDELVLGGGVGQNKRLQRMLSQMCTERDASVFVPDDRFLRDNAGMIAVVGEAMFSAGETISIHDSGVRPEFRPDVVPVTWWVPSKGGGLSDVAVMRGAEAVVSREDQFVRKTREPKSYRHSSLDDRLRRERTAMEARLIHEARQHGVRTPVIRDVDLDDGVLVLERVGDADIGDRLSPEGFRVIGRWLATLHQVGMVHGDPTTRNIRVNDHPYLIDFGLGYYTRDVEDFAMDLHVLFQSLRGITDEASVIREMVEDGYVSVGDKGVLDRVNDIERRGRYQSAGSAT